MARKTATERETAHEAHREILRDLAAARTAFWRRAQAEGWRPSCPESLARKKKLAPGPEDLPTCYRAEGASPGVWPPEAVRTVEWRRWKRSRDRAFSDHGGLVVDVVKKRTIRHAGADMEEVWAEARIALLRGIDLYDVDLLNPETGAPYAPVTYLYRWVKMGCGRGIAQWAKLTGTEHQDETYLPDGIGTDEDRMVAALDAAYEEMLTSAA